MSASKRRRSRETQDVDRYADHVTIHEDRVPEQFRHLIPHAKYWSIGDDADRGELMAGTPKAKKKALVDAVEQHWEALLAWCQSNDCSDEGVIFTNLIEAVAEAKLDLYPPAPDSPSPAETPLTAEQASELKATADFAQSILEGLNGPHPSDPEQVAKASAAILDCLNNLSAERNQGKPAFPEPIAKSLAELNARLDRLLARKASACADKDCRKPESREAEPGT